MITGQSVRYPVRLSVLLEPADQSFVVTTHVTVILLICYETNTPMMDTASKLIMIMMIIDNIGLIVVYSGVGRGSGGSVG